uniref:CSON005970 protein n=1 Tax=Culicoides sonorensis TaxID=179676 RepID=A0A336MSD8_CULSO
MTTSLGSCIGLKSPAVSKFREPYGLCCTNNIPSVQNATINTNNSQINGITPINTQIYGPTGYFNNSNHQNNNNYINNLKNNNDFAPPPPPPPIKGPLPTRRLESQIPAEAPACVQNAMMTKDKKPFTYTPGGIDLSQIKSPRMAKRVQKNALSEGVTGPPKVSPLAQQNQTQQKMPAQHMAKDVTGMPFQVFPTGPPAPPPPPTRQPPPQQQQHQENGTQNGNRQKSPKPQQHFEPPPMGFRPEIKIPQNPMANLKPTPRPQQNDDFWIEEYKSDKAAEPVLGAAPVTAPVAPKTPTTPQSPQTKPELDENKQDPSKHMSLHEKKGQLGQLYIPTPTEMDKQQLMNQQSPPWMSSNKAQANKDPAPEWVNSPQAISQQNNNQNERRIPIQFERTPTKTPGLTPMTPNLCPTPFYGAGKSPVSAAAVVNAFEPTFNSPQVYSPSVQYNPNQFVNQGYQNADYYQQQQQQQQQPRQVQTPQSAGPTGGVTRIIPIKLEGAQSPVTPNYRGPVSQSPIVVQSDPRQHQNWTNNPGGAPTQSRSFKVLQKITDAYSAADPADMSDTVPMQYQQAHYSKPMSPGADGQSDNVDTSMRRMKLNDEDQAFMNRVRNQGPANNRPRQGRPAQNRNEPDEDEAASKPYVPPSEQQVFEPKKYTGANIPSRSFRLLQAMTQPENVAEYAEYLQQLVRSESTDTNSSNLNNNENNNTLNNNNFTHFPFPPIPSNTNFPIPPNFSPFPIGTPFNFGGFIPPPAMPPPPNFDHEMLMQFPQIPFPPFLPTPNVTGLNQHPNTENVQSNSSKEIPKPKLTEDLMNDLERLKDVELIDLLDDTTKSILDSLKSLQLQYGIHLDGLDEDECNKRAADLLKSDNKATLYSSLTNLLKRDCSSGSILSMHSLSERHPEESCELTEEKVNLIRSLSNLLKAEKCITETIQSQSRSRLNSFTTSEKSVRVRTISEGEKSGFDEKKIGDNLATPRASLTSIQSIEISSDSENNEAKSKTELNEQGSLQNTTEVQSEDKVCENDTNKNEEEEEEKNSESQNNQEEEEEEIDFWASIKSDDDILPPKRPLWSTRKSSFMQESTLEEVETETIEKTSQETSEVDNKNDLEMDNENESQPFPTESTMSLDIEQEIRDLHEYEAQHNLELPLDDIAPPEDFQDQNTPTAENQPDSISVTSNQSQSSNMNPEQYAMMLQAMYHNYYTNPANSALLANPVYYQQYLAYQQYLQNMYYQQQQQQQQQHHHQSQTMSSNYPENDQEGDFEEEEEYCDQSEASEWYDMSQQEQHPGFVNHQESHYDNFQESSNEVQNQSHDSGHQISENHFDYATNSNQNCHDDGNEEEHQADEQDNENYIQSQNDILPENEIETKNLEEDHCAYNASPVEVPEIKVNALDSETIAQLQQNIDLVVEDHTELLEDEAIVEGKMLIIPSEIVTGDTSLSQDDELSTSCTVVTATTIEKRPYEYNKTQSNSENSSKSEQIVVYEIDDQSPTVSIDRQEGNTSECESIGEEEQEIESLHNSEMIEEDPSEECSDVEEGECDEISPLTYFKNNVNEHLPHQLSVIFEASEYSERASVRSSSVDSESEISHEITETQRNGKMCEDNEDSESEDVKVSISLPLKKPEVKEEPTITDDVVSVVVNLTPKGPSLERTFSGSRHNSIIDDNDSDVLVSVSLPLKRNKFSSQSLNVACEDINEENEHENVDVNESFDAYESFDMDEEHPPPIVHEPVKKVLEKQKSIEVEVQHQEMQPLHPMTYTTDDNTDTDSNMGDNEYETSAQSSSTMINEQSLTALSNLNNFMNFNQTFSRASSVPPCLSSTTTDSNKTDEAIQRRFQTLREQWGQLVKANNEDNDKSNEKAGSSWKITFFDDNQDWFNRRVESEDREVTPSRPQSCLPIQCPGTTDM